MQLHLTMGAISFQGKLAFNENACLWWTEATFKKKVSQNVRRIRSAKLTNMDPPRSGFN